MQRCSVVKKLRIVRGGLEDYRKLSRFHYRDSRLGPFAAIFALRSGNSQSVGVVVYTMPSPGLELRNIAVGNIFTGLGRSMRLKIINKNFRCISRVIIEPRYRGLGLASELVSRTMPQMKTAVIESMAVMGLVNPFFEKAGMTAYHGPMPARCVQMIEAFSMAGIEKDLLTDTEKIQHRLEKLDSRRAAFIEREIGQFLQSYGKRRFMPAGWERTGFVLSKLTARPVYYIWFNPEMKFSF
jgi:GNAT superfamily N-acetyltransferase